MCPFAGFGINRRYPVPARPVEVEVRHKPFLVPLVYDWRVYLGNMPITQCLTDNATVLGFHQSIVAAMGITSDEEAAAAEEAEIEEESEVSVATKRSRAYGRA
ncbi:hypothetical protein BH23PAT2_BH23PAT2_08000 [soil metagenome]